MIASISKAGLLSSRFHVWFVMAAVGGITIGHGGEVPGGRKAPANPARPGAVEHIDADERRQAALLMPSLDAVEQSIRVFRADVRSRFEAGDFAWLEAKATELKRGEQLFGNGSWKIHQFYMGIDSRFGRSNDQFLHDMGRLRRWREAMPDSVTAKIAEGEFWVEYAWFARQTSGPVRDRAHFRERIANARKLLMPMEDGFKADRATWDPAWGMVMLRVAMAQAWPREEFDGLVKTLKEWAPRYWGYDLVRADSLLPRWYGITGNDWVAYADWAANLPEGLGDEVYARIVVRMVGLYGNVFRDSNADRNRALRGIQSMLHKYPESDLVASHAARIAVLGRDRELARRLFDRLGDTYIERCWNNAEQFVHFRTWAKTGEW